MLKINSAAFTWSMLLLRSLLKKLRPPSICFASTFGLFLIPLVQVVAEREDAAHLTVAVFRKCPSLVPLLVRHPVIPERESWCQHMLYSVELFPFKCKRKNTGLGLAGESGQCLTSHCAGVRPFPTNQHNRWALSLSIQITSNIALPCSPRQEAEREWDCVLHLLLPDFAYL